MYEIKLLCQVIPSFIPTTIITIITIMFSTGSYSIIHWTATINEALINFIVIIIIISSMKFSIVISSFSTSTTTTTTYSFFRFFTAHIYKMSLVISISLITIIQHITLIILYDSSL